MVSNIAFLLSLVFVFSNFIFTTSELGLNFEPPIEKFQELSHQRSQNATLRNAIKNKDPEATVAKIAEAVALPFSNFIPPEVVHDIILKLGKKVERVIESIDTNEYTTLLGVPCNPNEAKLCFKRTTTTTSEPSGSKKQKRSIPSFPNDLPKHLPSDYERPPPQAAEFNEIIAQARKAFDRQTAIGNELNEEYRTRKFFNYLNGQDLVKESDDQDFRGKVEPLSVDYKKKKSNVYMTESIIGHQPNLRGWFPDVVNRLQSAEVMSLARRRLQATSSDITFDTKSPVETKTNTPDEVIVHIEAPLEKEYEDSNKIGLGSERVSMKSNQKDNTLENYNSESPSITRLDIKQIDEGTNNDEEDVNDAGTISVASSPQSATAWHEHFFPSFLWSHVAIPEFLSTMFYKDTYSCADYEDDFDDEFEEDFNDEFEEHFNDEFEDDWYVSDDTDYGNNNQLTVIEANITGSKDGQGSWIASILPLPFNTWQFSSIKNSFIPWFGENGNYINSESVAVFDHNGDVLEALNQDENKKNGKSKQKEAIGETKQKKEDPSALFQNQKPVQFGPVLQHKQQLVALADAKDETPQNVQKDELLKQNKSVRDFGQISEILDILSMMNRMDEVKGLSVAHLLIAEGAKPESAKPESAKAESAKAESAKAESAKAESDKTESAKTESAKTESANYQLT